MTFEQVEALRQLSLQELIDFFNEYVKIGASQRKTLSVRVYGKLHSSEYEAEASQPHLSKIDNIFSFRRSQSLYPSFKGLSGQMKL